MINNYSRNANKKSIYTKTGVTLIELMVALFVSAIVLTTAFMIWSRVQRDIVRATTRQTLLNEMRRVSNYMQNDFKSIKYDEKTFSLTEGTNGNFSMSFEKFKEADEKKELLHEAVEKVTYTLSNSVLTRMCEGNHILSVHCDGVSIKKSVNESTGATDLESSDEDFKAGREAQLDIEITGKMPIPGANDDMYYVEKTSVVMRNEYSKKVNKNYISTFDLIQKESKDIAKEGSSTFFPDGAIDPDALKILTVEQLTDLKGTQNEMLKEAQEQLENINKSIGDTEDGRKWYQKVGDWFKSGEQDGEKISRCRNTLEKAKTVEEVEAVKNELKTWSDDQELMFIGKSYPNYENGTLSDKERELIKAAYDMKVQDRLIEQANKTAQENAEEGETVEAAQLSIDQYKEKINTEDVFKDANGQVITVTNDNSEDSGTSKADAQAVVSYYEQIDVSWMDESEYEKDMNIYSAAKSLLSEADTKIDVIKAMNLYEDNIKLIDDELSRR